MNLQVSYIDEYSSEEEDSGIEEGKESLLPLAEKYSVETMLTYHYRTKDSSIIEFSNEHFYKNQLNLCKMPEHFSSNVKKSANLFIENIDGRWIPTNNTAVGRGGVNLKEAKWVVEKVLEIQRKHPSWTIAVVTFNRTQKEKIDELLNENSDIRWRIDNSSEDLIVRNIVNVQGDERDVVIFSVAYGKFNTDSSRITSRFGSLSKEDVENRLNVALTRAREQIHIVKSFEYTDIANRKSLSKGTQLFYEWIKYLDTDKEDDVVEHSVYENNEFEEDFQ